MYSDGLSFKNHELIFLFHPVVPLLSGILLFSLHSCANKTDKKTSPGQDLSLIDLLAHHFSMAGSILFAPLAFRCLPLVGPLA